MRRCMYFGGYFVVFFRTQFFGSRQSEISILEWLPRCLSHWAPLALTVFTCLGAVMAMPTANLCRVHEAIKGWILPPAAVRCLHCVSPELSTAWGPAILLWSPGLPFHVFSHTLHSNFLTPFLAFPSPLCHQLACLHYCPCCAETWL